MKSPLIYVNRGQREGRCRFTDSGFSDFKAVDMPKDFKTIEELIEILESRGVSTDANTAAILKRESYYAIVNGYKDPFLDRDAMQRSNGDFYKPGTTFTNIYDLFTYDRALRRAVMPYLMAAETAVKSAVVYAFCERNQGMLDYLDRDRYVSGRDMLVPEGFKGSKLEERDKNLGKLLKILSKKNKPNERSKKYAIHYVERYGGIPLWVLQNDMTFGNISNFYQLQKRGIQNATCRIVSEVNGNGKRIGARDLLNALSVLVGFRNICAHDERLYCARVIGHGFDHMLDALALILSYEEIEEMTNGICHVTEPSRNKVRPEALNAMYTDEKDIPKEYR